MGAAEAREVAATRPPFTRRDGWYLGGLVALTFAYFWRAALGFGIFFHEDLHNLFYPVKAFYVEALRAGRLPMWNPYIAAGYPQFAEGQIAALYPLNPLLFGLLPLPLAFNHMIIWHFALAGVFFYLFLRKRGLGGPAAFIGASIFEWSGFMTAHLQHPSITCSVAWLPLLLYFFEDGRQRAQAGRSLWRPMLAGGVVVALQALVAYPPVMYYSLLTGAIYLLCAGIGVKRAALLWGGVFVIGLSVSAVQWLPSAQMADRYAPTGITPLQYYEFMTSAGLTPRQALTLLLPHSFGSPAYGTYVGVRYLWEVCGYLGVLSLALAAWGAARRRRRSWPFVVIGLVGLALAFGPDNPIYRVLSHVPVINSFRAAGRYLLLWTVAGSALAAEGVEGLLARRAMRSRATIFMEAAAVVLGVAGVAILLWFRREWPAHGSRPAALASEWVFLAVSLALFGALVIAARAGGSRRLLWAVSGGVVLADLLAFAAPLAPVAPVASLYGPAPWTARRIAADSSWYRVWAWRTMTPQDPFFGDPWPWALEPGRYRQDQERLRPNLPIRWRLRALSADAAFMTNLGWLEQRILAASYSDLYEGFRYVPPVANLLGVKYLVLTQPDPGFELMEERNQLLLYRNHRALPRAWVVGAVEVADDESAEVERATSAGVDHRQGVLLDAPPPIPLNTRGEVPSKITFEEPRPEILRVRTRTAAPGMLVVSETYNDDWRATLDGRQTRIYRAEYFVRAVFLPAGEHTVEFRYDNAAYRLGLGISLFMAALWTVLALRVWSRGRRLRLRA
jgi:hypothetical protein